MGEGVVTGLDVDERLKIERGFRRQFVSDTISMAALPDCPPHPDLSPHKCGERGNLARR